MGKTILLKRSAIEGKAPSAESLQPGEVAINYYAGGETLYVKNTNNEVVGTYINGNFQTATEALALHVSRTDNPHGVTKADIGLPLVENIAPMDMPISTAQRTELDKKLNKRIVDERTGLPTSESGIVDALNMNNAAGREVALSAYGGYLLSQQANNASGGASVALESIETRLNNVESAWETNYENTKSQADAIIAKAVAWQSDPNVADGENNAHSNFV